MSPDLRHIKEKTKPLKKEKNFVEEYSMLGDSYGLVNSDDDHPDFPSHIFNFFMIVQLTVTITTQ